MDHQWAADADRRSIVLRGNIANIPQVIADNRGNSTFFHKLRKLPKMIRVENRQFKSAHPELDSFIYPSRNIDSLQRTLISNPLDELDCLNHYCFGGRKNMNQDFLVLTLNDHSPGDETLFIAVQLLGTQSRVVHFDPSPLGVELARSRAQKIGVADKIVWVTPDLQNVHRLFSVANDEKLPGLQKFDYVRCCGALNYCDDFDASLREMIGFIKPSGALGMSCFGAYGREPYRQFQAISDYLNSDEPGIQEEIDRLKELFVFSPEKNWTRLTFDNLLHDVRSMKDDAFAANFVRKDRCGLTVPELYDVLEKNDLDLVNFARHTRIMYQPWFAQKDPNLLELLKSLPIQDTQAVAEIAWNIIEEHIFWASRQQSSRADWNDWDNVPFFNPVSQSQNGWREKLLKTRTGVNPQLLVEITAEEKYAIELPWNPQIHRMIELIDGCRTFKDIVMTIREEQHGRISTENILQSCTQFLTAAELEDIILLRHPKVVPLPFTSRTF